MWSLAGCHRVLKIICGLAAVCAEATVSCGQTTRDLPAPGVGVYFRAADVAALRIKIQQPPCRPIYERLRQTAQEGLKQWPDDKVRLRVVELASQLPDLTMEFVPKELSPPGGREAGSVLERHAVHFAPAAAFVYLMTGERPFADYAWDVFEQCGRVNRWGWFPWSGAHLPQIHFGIVSRNLVLIADCIWDRLSAAERQHAREVIAEKCVEPYYRLVLHTPGMGLYHLRSRNQGNNALSAALIGSMFVGDAVPDNSLWFRSLLQTFHWTITHDIGWMGQGLESGIGGYWTVSMQNLYTAAAVLNNVKGIDLRGHPGFEQATYYPIIHEVTIPPVGLFSDRIDPAGNPPLMGVIGGKPIELPGGGSTTCGPWFLDYAKRKTATAARYFAQKTMIRPDRLQFANGHQELLADVLAIAWWDDELLRPGSAPTESALFTDRMVNLRSGYSFGDTSLYFNGDLSLTAKKESLGTTSGMSWHFPWHQYQIAETGIETEGELFAPSMFVEEAGSDAQFGFFKARSGFSNVAYYPSAEQRESHRNYDQRERSALYVRHTDDCPEYFVFLDEVRQANPRWHAWTWHLWNPVDHPQNSGRFVPQGTNAVRAERPNADLWIQFLTSDRMAFEQHGIPGQPSVSYQMDHNVQMLRAIAGDYEAVNAKPLTIRLDAWPDFGEVQEDALFLANPPTGKEVVSQVVSGIQGGVRYCWSLQCKEQDYRVYEETAWTIDLELLDAAGNVLAKPTTPRGHPHPLRLGAPASDLKTHDWLKTVQYFDAPPEAAACRAKFHAVSGAHYFELGKLWLKAIEFQPVGRPDRRLQQRFVTLVMPLDRKAQPPQIRTDVDGKSTVTHADGSRDEIAVTAEGRLTLIRRQEHQVPASFTGRPSAGQSALSTNSEASAQQLAAGLRPLTEEFARERDRLIQRGRRNLAAAAKVTASETRDERFSAKHVIDNQTSEYPADGHLDYTQGIVWSSGRTVGYGTGTVSLLSGRDYWPLYVRPTYWLLPEEMLGHVELELSQPAAVDTVRLLNTSNAGLNDFAAHTFRIELYDANRKLLTSKSDAFGKACDRPFQQAFVKPDWFRRYAPPFAGMLEPGLTVPFGDGWKEVTFQDVAEVKFVRVVLTKYWGIGGGLNEIQVYGL